MTQQMPGQYLASKLIGTTVVSSNNESIGDVNDVLVDRQGQVQAVVIGVGGFLGIGEKDVAVPFRSLEFTSRETMSATGSTGTAGSGGTASGTAGSGTAGTGTAGSGTAASGTTASGTTAGTAGAGSAARSASDAATAPDRIMLRLTKADLQAAPAFQTAGRSGTTDTGAARTGTAPAGSTGTGTAPRQ